MAVGKGYFLVRKRKGISYFGFAHVALKTTRHRINGPLLNHIKRESPSNCRGSFIWAQGRWLAVGRPKQLEFFLQLDALLLQLFF